MNWILVFAQFARVLPYNCTGASSGGDLEGVCKKATDCDNEGGEIDGTCNQAFSICCICKYHYLKAVRCVSFY